VYRSDVGDGDVAGGSIRLEELGSWVNNFRPSKIRIYHNYNGGLDVILRDKDLQVIAQDGSFNNGEEISIDWNDADIYDLFFDKYDEVYEVQGIEFYVEC
jgi:hypothetical protein